MGYAHRQAISRRALLPAQAVGALLLGLALVVTIPPAAAILATGLIVYGVFARRSDDHQQQLQRLIVTVAFIAPILLYFALAVAR